MDAVTCFETGSNVSILETQSVLQRYPELVGAAGTVVESPQHPNTWYSVRPRRERRAARAPAGTRAPCQGARARAFALPKTEAMRRALGPHASLRAATEQKRSLRIYIYIRRARVVCVCVCVTRRVARCCLSSPWQVRVADGRTLKLQPTALQLVDEAGEPIVAEAVNGNGADGANGKNGASEAATHVERLRRGGRVRIRDTSGTAQRTVEVR